MLGGLACRSGWVRALDRLLLGTAGSRRSEREVSDWRPDYAPPRSEEAGLYVHWPYCRRRCSYCNFNKYVSQRVDQQAMRDCLQRETETLLHLSQVSRISSVFFGGGTPSLARPDTIAGVLETVAKCTSLPGNAEVTLEVNPTPEDVARLSEFSSAGVNRFSIGVQVRQTPSLSRQTNRTLPLTYPTGPQICSSGPVLLSLQSLHDADLELLGRDHSSQHALQALAEAQRLCPGRVSVDVIFGRPGQKLQSWEKELEDLLLVSDDHVSLYQLTLERGTALFKRVQQSELTMPSDDVTAHMYEAARRILGKAGFLQYEVSNFTRNGAISVHNQGYWRASQYIGVGPGAHGRFVPRGAGGSRREARTQTLEPDVWMREVRHWGHGTRRRVELSTLGLLEEVLVMGLRMTEGVPHENWRQFSPLWSLQEVVGQSQEVQELLEGGLLVLDDRGMRCSWDGLALLDSLLPTLLVQLHAHFSQQEAGRH